MQNYRLTDNITAGVLFILFAILCMALMNVTAKYLSTEIHPVQITFYRNIIALVFLFIFLISTRRQEAFKTKRLKSHIFRGVLGNLAIIFAFIAFSYLALADAVALIFTSPIFVALLSGPILGEKVGLYRWGAIILGFAGLLIVAQPTGAISIIGALAALASGICSGLTNIYLRDFGYKEGVWRCMFYFLLIGSVFTGLGLPLYGSMPGLELLGIIFALGIFGFMVQFLKTKAYSFAPASFLAPFLYTLFLWSVLFDWLIWNKAVSLLVLAGACVIIFSNLMLTWIEKRSARKIPPIPRI